MAELIGSILMYIFLFAWIPYAFFTVSRTLFQFLIPGPPSQEKEDKPETKTPHKRSKKTKRNYEVVSDYKPEHNIVHPLDEDN